MNKTPHITFIILYRAIALPLMKFIVKRMGGDQDAAEEVFSRTVSAAWEGYHSFKNKSKFFTWICSIALNKIADYYREEVHKNSVLIAPLLEEIAFIEDDRLSPDEKIALQEMRSSVRECIRLLPQDKKRYLFLRFWKQMTIKEIAGMTGESERVVEGQLYRAKKMLGKAFETVHPELIPASESLHEK